MKTPLPEGARIIAIRREIVRAERVIRSYDRQINKRQTCVAAIAAAPIALWSGMLLAGAGAPLMPMRAIQAFALGDMKTP